MTLNALRFTILKLKVFWVSKSTVKPDWKGQIMIRITPIFKMCEVYLDLNSHWFEIKFSQGIASSNYLCGVTT